MVPLPRAAKACAAATASCEAAATFSCTMAASFAALNRYPTSYWGTWGFPNEVAARVGPVLEAYGSGSGPHAWVQGLAFRTAGAAILFPLDPLYLSWIARLKGFEPRFIALADEINRAMPRHAVSLVMDALNERGRCVQGARVLVLGVTYKRDVSDMRESPALEIMHMLAQRGAILGYADPFVPQLVVGDLKLASARLTDETLARADCVVIATDHRAFDYAAIARQARLVVDLRNALGGIRDHREKIVTL